jgi:hypothetical protein
MMTSKLCQIFLEVGRHVDGEIHFLLDAFGQNLFHLKSLVRGTLSTAYHTSRKKLNFR